MVHIEFCVSDFAYVEGHILTSRKASSENSSSDEELPIHAIRGTSLTFKINTIWGDDGLVQ